MTAKTLAEPLAALESATSTPTAAPLLAQLTGGDLCDTALRFDRLWYNWGNNS